MLAPLMATIECRSVQAGIPSQWVDVRGITDEEVVRARERLDQYLVSRSQVSTAVADAFLDVATDCPRANPSDLWQHVIYRHLLNLGWSDNRWKRVSGYALERAFESLYGPLLSPYGLRMRIVPLREANRLLEKVGLGGTRANKIDLFLEGEREQRWIVFGAVHVKSSIAERIQDDVPASLAFIIPHLLDEEP